MSDTAAPKPINSVRRAVAILKAFRHAESLSLSEVAQQAGLHPSTAHHLVQTLVSERLLDQDPITRRYTYGLGLLGIATPAVRAGLLTRALRGPMAACAAACGFDVWAAVLQSGRVAYVLRAGGRNPHRYSQPRHLLQPAYCVSPGRVLLSAYDPDQLRDILRHQTIRHYTDRTVTDIDALVRIIGRVRAAGYAEVLGEHIEGARDIAVPVRDDEGEIIAALSVGELATDFTDDHLPFILAALRRAAAAVEAALTSGEAGRMAPP